MEVILDRRMMQDDKRGLEQGVRDTKRTLLEVGRNGMMISVNTN